MHPDSSFGIAGFIPVWLCHRWSGAATRKGVSHWLIWPDYKPSVIRIAQFHYAPTASAYNIFFELPVFLVQAAGTREIVMYNPLDEHIMLSHASWNLTR